jgi:exopolysaccharide biosynthesis protein
VVNPIPEWIQSAVGGNPLVLENGKAIEPPSCAPHFCELHPRSAVGLSRDEKTLFLLAVDGRSAVSKGATTFEVGTILKQLGAWRGLNLDGGGSTALYLASKGIVNVPSDRHERVVANHIGICDG